MKYVILSDIHSNLEAFEAVEKAFEAQKVGENIICVGDTVGYGADPNECVRKIASLNAKNILGNHDAAVIDKTDITYFNEVAKDAVYWTVDNLNTSSRSYLEKLELIYDADPFTVVHGTLHNPEEFIYMMGVQEALRTFGIMERKICFIGHSHVPGVFVLKEEEVSYVEPGKIKLEKDAKYIINAGSVGQPRDGDNRACYCIYDSEKEEINFYRVEYDIKSAQKRILDAGLPRPLAERLGYGW